MTEPLTAETPLDLAHLRDVEDKAQSVYYGVYNLTQEIRRQRTTLQTREAERETMRAGYETILAALDAENARLRAALQPLADLADCFPPDWDDSADLIANSVTLGDVRRARALLEGKTDGP